MHYYTPQILPSQAFWWMEKQPQWNAGKQTITHRMQRVGKPAFVIMKPSVFLLLRWMLLNFSVSVRENGIEMYSLGLFFQNRRTSFQHKLQDLPFKEKKRSFVKWKTCRVSSLTL